VQKWGERKRIDKKGKIKMKRAYFLTEFKLKADGGKVNAGKNCKNNDSILYDWMLAIDFDPAQFGLRGNR
jgi:hypothetical protein